MISKPCKHRLALQSSWTGLESSEPNVYKQQHEYWRVEAIALISEKAEKITGDPEKWRTNVVLALCPSGEDEDK